MEPIGQTTNHLRNAEGVRKSELVKRCKEKGIICSITESKESLWSKLTIEEKKEEIIVDEDRSIEIQESKISIDRFCNAIKLSKRKQFFAKKRFANDNHTHDEWIKILTNVRIF